MRREDARERTFVTAGLGFALGIVAVPLLVSPAAPVVAVVFAALVAITALSRDSRAAGGGFIVAFALWWIWFIRRAVDQCADFNRNGGSCEIYGTTEQLILASCVGVIGIALVLVALRGRSMRA